MSQAADADAQPHAAAGSAPVGHAWSPAQVVRLEAEWRRLQRDFAFHPYVAVVPLSGDPPDEYQVHYRVTTLAVDAVGQLAYVPAMPVHVWLPPHFPHEAPVVRPMSAAFHPNVSAEWIHLGPPWGPDASLAEVVTQVGQMLAYRSYDPAGVLNPVAMKWAYDNPQLLPTDGGADFSPAADGGPLARIARSAPDLLDDLRRRAEATCERLAASVDAAPSEREIELFATEARRTLELFLEPDVPEVVRAKADELEELVVSMQGPGSAWRRVARQAAAARDVGAAVARVAAAEEALAKAMADAQAPPPSPPTSPAPAAADPGESGAPVADVKKMLAQVPPLTFLQPLALSLGGAVREAEAAVAQLRHGLEHVGTVLGPPGIPPGRLLARRLELEAARLAAAAEPARESGAALASLEPALDRARTDAAAVERLADWAEFLDLSRRGDELVERLAAIDPETLQAYRVVADSDASGPFEFEQRVQAAGMSLVVSNPRGASVRVIDADSEELLVAGDGEVAVPAPARARGAGSAGGAGAAGPPAAFSVRPTEHTDDLRVQLEYLLTETRAAIARLAPDATAEGADEPEPWPTDFWAGQIAADLADPEARAAVRQKYRRASHRWKALLVDLAAIGRFKQRRATYYLLARLVEFVPRAKGRVNELKEILTRSEARLAEIAARSSGSVETGEPIIPRHLAAEYADRLAERDGARQELARLAKSLEAATRRAGGRLSKPRLYGTPDLPAFRVLPALPATYLESQPPVSDAAVEALAEHLERLLETKLRDRADAATARTPPEA